MGLSRGEVPAGRARERFRDRFQVSGSGAMQAVAGFSSRIQPFWPGIKVGRATHADRRAMHEKDGDKQRAVEP